MGDLSPHFSRREFDCPDGAIAHPDPQLLAALEELRRLKGGHPLNIVSGFRTVTYNRKVGGAPNSQHLWNRAADIPLGYCTVGDAEAAGFRGIGFVSGYGAAPSVVHVDVRPGPLTVFVDP